MSPTIKAQEGPHAQEDATSAPSVDAIADRALEAFLTYIRAHPRPTNRDLRNRRAMIAALEAVWVALDPFRRAPTVWVTARESEVLEKLAQGMQNKQIAKELCISPSTVGAHLHNIYVKDGVPNDRDMVAAMFLGGQIGCNGGHQVQAA